MQHAFLDYVLFLAKTLTWLAAVAMLLILVAAVRRQRSSEGHFELRQLNDRYADYRQQLQVELLDEKAYKAWARERKREAKERQQQERKRAFVLRFDGDMRASAVAHLREEITALLSVAQAGQDQVVLCLESPGGVVHGYGLAASQLHRLRQAGLQLTVCVDKVAASGGYMMAAVADRIVAAPFAVIGSIGVVAQLPNLHRFLQKHEVDIELHTAGAYKRTLTLLGENTEEGRAKFKEELESTHVLFKSFVAEHRPVLDLDKVATGEHWFARQALELHLVDELATSDHWISALCADHQVYELSYKLPKPWMNRLGVASAQALSALIDRLASVRFIP